MVPNDLKRRQAMALIQKRMQACQNDFSTFVETVCKSDQGKPLVLGAHHKQWHKHVKWCWEHDLRCLIMAPMNHGKSTGLTVPLAAWMIGNDPNIIIKIITNDDSMASKRVAAVKRIIESPIYKQVFPLIEQGDKWTDSEFYVVRASQSADPTLQARGIFTTGVGTRAHLIIFDDIVDQKNSIDQVQRERVLSTLDQTWLTRLVPNGKVLMVGTAWAMNDATQQCLQREGWCGLVQRIADDCESIAQELVTGYPDVSTYPGIII